MTKKDYQRIVDDLATAQNAVEVATCYDVETRTETIRAVAKAFAYSEQRLNPRFDASRFYAAITKATGITF